MRDALGRQIDYLRLSVTDRCDLRCVYCMPEVGVPLVGHADVLTVDETVRAAGLVRDAAGIRKIRITGGEPLVRRGLIAIVEGLSSLGFDELTLTTNGVLLGDHAAPLATAGVQRVNVSLDSLIDHRLAAISRRPLKLSDLEDSIRRAQKAGLAPVRINCVVLGGWNDDEIPAMLLWGERMGVTVRFIEHMPSRLEEDCLDRLSRVNGDNGTGQEAEEGATLALRAEQVRKVSGLRARWCKAKSKVDEATLALARIAFLRKVYEREVRK